MLYRVAKVRSWTYTQTQNVIETTALGDTDRTIEDGVRSGSGTCSLYYYNPDRDDAADLGAGRLLRKILKPLSRVDPKWNNQNQESRGDTNIRSGYAFFRLTADKNLDRLNTLNSSTAKYIWVNAWITSFTMNMAVGEILSCDISFEVDGTPLDNTFSPYGDGDD